MTWKQKATASLLQLDISGAFDTVNYTRLLATLREYGFPRWLVLWVRAWLIDQVAIIHFDGQPTQDIPVIVGVPQGFLLSPILFSLTAPVALSSGRFASWRQSGTAPAPA